MAQDGHRRVARGVRLEQCAPQFGAHAENVEQAGGHAEAGQLLRRTIVRVGGIPPFERGEPAERVAGLLAPVHEVPGRHRLTREESLVPIRGEHDRAIHAGVTERTQHQRIRHREHGAIGGDCHREHEHDCQRQRRLMPHDAPRMTQVVPQRAGEAVARLGWFRQAVGNKRSSGEAARQTVARRCRTPACDTRTAHGGAPASVVIVLNSSERSPRTLSRHTGSRMDHASRRSASRGGVAVTAAQDRFESGREASQGHVGGAQRLEPACREREVAAGPSAACLARARASPGVTQALLLEALERACRARRVRWRGRCGSRSGCRTGTACGVLAQVEDGQEDGIFRFTKVERPCLQCRHTTPAM